MRDLKDRENTDLFESNLDAHLQTWRDVTPPPYLKNQIAAAVAPRRRSYWRPLLAAGVCAGVIGVFLTWPGSPAQPAPAFAEVQKAMQAVESMSYTRVVESKYSDGIVEQETGQYWLRRYPLAYAWESVARLPGKELQMKEFSDEKQTIVFKQFQGKPGNWEIHPQKPDFRRDIERRLLIYTQPGTDDLRDTKVLRTKYNMVLPPWQTSEAVLNGQPVWIFSRTFRFDPKKPKEQQRGIRNNELTVIRLFADTRSRRVLRQEMLTTYFNSQDYRRSTATDFHYNEPAPSTLRNIHPPKEVSY